MLVIACSVVTFHNFFFNRMQQALRKFAIDDTSVSGYIYHRLLGHDVDDVLFRSHGSKHYSAPHLPELNRSQV